MESCWGQLAGVGEGLLPDDEWPVPGWVQPWAIEPEPLDELPDADEPLLGVVVEAAVRLWAAAGVQALGAALEPAAAVVVAAFETM